MVRAFCEGKKEQPFALPPNKKYCARIFCPFYVRTPLRVGCPSLTSLPPPASTNGLQISGAAEGGGILPQKRGLGLGPPKKGEERPVSSE